MCVNKDCGFGTVTRVYAVYAKPKTTAKADNARKKARAHEEARGEEGDLDVISDTLLEADAEIRAYLAAGADYGAEINKQIAEVLASMDALRRTLDALQTEVSAYAKELKEKAKRVAREKRV